MKNIITVEQIKAARHLLGWDQTKLASAAALGIATVRRFEAVPGPADTSNKSVQKMQAALENAGIQFIFPSAKGGSGVRLKT